MTQLSTSAAIDRAIIFATQEGLPLLERPFAAIASGIGCSTEAVMERMRRMRAQGTIRRIAAVPNHYALGLRHNGMTVWDVDDAEVARLGPLVGALSFVTHCYRRPRVVGSWRYNLFAMVHGQSRGEVDEKVGEIAGLLGASARAHDVLFSTRILKKTGFRLRA